MAALLSQNGSVVRDPQGGLWIIYDGAKFRVPDRETVEWLFPHAHIHDVRTELIEQIPIEPRDGALLREEPAPIYVICGGAKLLIPDQWALSRLFDTARVRNLWPGALEHLPLVPRDGTVLCEETDDHVYEIVGGRKRLISKTPNAGSVRRLWRGALDRFPTA